ncbi:uncharacterized protein LOC128668057 [Microplitis demolitor]|uniref:uncharacterized protein LOC128668057 n=1 Tax=Microplitis demolitor TaxID=69319 RepID=UPI00235B6EAC|nr:uncharacterized protein LOC128668057 [Microplitis demolitor]
MAQSRGIIDAIQSLVDTIAKSFNDLQQDAVLVSVELFCKFRNAKDEKTVEETKSFNIKSSEISPATSLADWYTDNVYEKLLKKVEDFNQKDSGWSLIEINNLAITMSRYAPLQAGDSTFVMLPKDIWDKKACVNAALHQPVPNPQKTSEYKHFSSILKYEGIKFPISIKDIPKFGKLNNLSINFYGIESEYTGKKTEKSEIIPLCLNHFRYEKPFEHHKADCFKVNKVRMQFLDENDKILKFKNHKCKDTVPFVVYADLECTLESQDDDDKTQKHVPHSISFYYHCSYDNKLSKFELNRSPAYIEWFSKKLKDLAIEFEEYLKHPIAMKPLTKQQQANHNQAIPCHICERSFSSNKDKCYDHCHFTGNYRGQAHISCNVNCPKSHVIPIVFHNLSGYDSHFLIKSLATTFEGDMTLLPINKERYISFTKSIANISVSLRFIDSFRFMESSLDKLASYLGDDEKQITKLNYPDQEQFKLVTRKGVFSYEYVDNVDKLDDKKLPDKDKFFSKLTDND